MGQLDTKPGALVGAGGVGQQVRRPLGPMKSRMAGRMIQTVIRSTCHPVDLPSATGIP